jgi:hypothetical protein
MRVDELALALRARDALRARVLYAQLLACDPATIEQPALTDELELAIAASITELIAARLGVAAPAWTQLIGPLKTPYALVTVHLPERLARLQRESPPQLRARNLVAPENFLLAA